jgi:polyisoprenyl-teichoic acid--peptidoglycan teichoic acid transferase
MVATLRRCGRLAVLALVLAVAGLVVPDSAVQPTDIDLVRVRHAEEVDAPRDVVWILAVGSDARRGQDMRRARGDALQLVGINTRTHAATAIGIPRDSWVAIPGHGREKINAALYFGGPRLMGRAVGNLVGVQPDYVMVSRFPFFENMVDVIGGIEVRNPRLFSDPYLYRTGFKAGRIHLNGYGAMAFSRVRKSLPGGDFDRSANQQRTLRGIHAKIRARAHEPGFIERGVMTVLQHLATDLPPGELFRLAQAVAQVEAGKITTCVVPGGVGYAGAQSVVFPNVATARRYGNDARRDATIRRC